MVSNFAVTASYRSSVHREYIISQVFPAGFQNFVNKLAFFSQRTTGMVNISLRL